MNHIKITQPGWENFSDAIAEVEFKNSVSVEPLSRQMIDRISAIIACSICEPNGKVLDEHAGVAQRLVGGVTIPVEVLEPMAKASERDAAAEQKRLQENSSNIPGGRFYTVKELEDIATKTGIRGLREAAAPWGVRGREIPKLIEQIMEAQAELKKRIEEKRAEQRRLSEDAEREALDAQTRREAAIDAAARVLTPPVKTEIEVPGGIVFKRVEQDGVVTLYATDNWPKSAVVSPAVVDGTSMVATETAVSFSVANGRASYSKTGVTENGEWMISLIEGEFAPMPKD